MKKLFSYLDWHLEECIVLSLLCYLVLSVNFEVFRRYVLNISSAYLEEVARFCSIWIVYLGVPYAIRHKRHIICDVIPSKLPQLVQLLLTETGTILFIIMSTGLLFGSIDLIDSQLMMDKRTEAMHAPFWIFTSVMAICSVLSLLRLVQALWLDIRSYRNGSWQSS